MNIYLMFTLSNIELINKKQLVRRYNAVDTGINNCLINALFMVNYYSLLITIMYGVNISWMCNA